MARKQLQDAERELGQSKELEKDALDKKGKLEHDLSNMQSRMQASIQAE
jgi:hypothetical protein